MVYRFWINVNKCYAKGLNMWINLTYVVICITISVTSCNKLLTNIKIINKKYSKRKSKTHNDARRKT